jgi:hypothetical protein
LPKARPKEQPLYVVARNNSGRPCLIHKLVQGTSSLTACGRDMSTWSRSYLPSLPNGFEVLQCRTAACRA